MSMFCDLDHGNGKQIKAYIWVIVLVTVTALVMVTQVIFWLNKKLL